MWKWTAWYRHIALALLTHAYLEVTRQQATTEEKGGGGLLALSVTEVRRLLLAVAEPPRHLGFRLAGLDFRRHNQAFGKVFHSRRRAE